uniref:PHD-type domain-containing protein n=1 Tax=Kalanchoe fedtschenkoi TaxID=63787 RepID=A0A7N0V9Q6_KALFE
MADSTTLRKNHTFVKKRKLDETDRPTFGCFSHPAMLTTLSSPYHTFRDNVRWFCHSIADLDNIRVDGFCVWYADLQNHRNGVVFRLYIVEEVVRPSADYFCFHCICAGWGNHFVCKRRYHLIVPKEASWGECLKDGALTEGQHLLHGMIHCNGFGHLLRVNGIETSASRLRRDEIMELFDVMCGLLKTRKVTVKDTLRKGQMELRLLHGIAYGKPWYGEWGYKFCRGSFGVTEQKYSMSVELLNSLDINKLLRDFSDDEVLRNIIHCYKDASDAQLTTISDMLDFMLAFKYIYGAYPIAKKPNTEESVTSSGPLFRVNKEHAQVFVSSPNKSGLSKCLNLSSWAEKLDCRYPKRRLQSTAQTVVLILRRGRNGFMQMGRHELREIMRQHVGDTGLIDYVLKSINNVIVGDKIVRRIYSSETKRLEFTVENYKGRKTPTSIFDMEDETAIPSPLGPPHFSSPLPEQASAMLAAMPGENVLDDISYVYKCIVRGYKSCDPVALASQAIIDSKFFVKEWKVEEEEKDSMSTWVVCRVLPSSDELTRFLPRPLPPGEIIEVPKGIEVKHLKLRLQSALRDTYCMMDEYVVREVLEHENGKGESLGVQAWVEGSGLDFETLLRYEAGPCDWKVDCEKCGSKEYDGEEMVQCTACKAWLHTRCIDAGDMEQQEMFLCPKCCCTRRA